MVKKIIKKILFHYLPRFLTIALVLFVSIYTLVIFRNDPMIFRRVEEFLIYFMPSIVMLLFLKIAWHHEFIGATLFVLLSFILLLTYQVYIGISVFSFLVLIAILFVIDGKTINKRF